MKQALLPEPGDQVFTRCFAGKTQIEVYRGNRKIFTEYIEPNYPLMIERIKGFGLKILWQRDIFIRSIMVFQLGEPEKSK